MYNFTQLHQFQTAAGANIMRIDLCMPEIALPKSVTACYTTKAMMLRA